MHLKVGFQIHQAVHVDGVQVALGTLHRVAGGDAGAA